MTYLTTAITDFGQELYVSEAARYLDPEVIEYERENLDRECMKELLRMLNHGVRMAVKFERVVFDDVARRRRVYSHRMQVDEVRIRERDITMFERQIGDYKRLPSVMIPQPFLPRPKPPEPPKPWHKQLRAFFKQTWDDTSKITGCKL